MLLELAPAVAGLLLAGLLGWTGAGKLTDRMLAARAGDTALARLLGDPRRAAGALRLVGAAEVLLAAALLLGAAVGAAGAAWSVGAGTVGTVAGGGAATLGAGFLGYLTWARVTDPGSSCGCTAGRNEPITWRAFARAGLVLAGGSVVLAGGWAGTGSGASSGAAATAPGRPWWSAVAAHPVAAAGALAAGAAVLAALSTDLDRRWLLPLRRARIRLFGHPLVGTGGPVPLAATVELLIRSRAWEAAAGVVRSGLVERWEADGWRILRYTGVSAGRPVSVLFALDATATASAAAAGPAAVGPAVRVSVVAEDTAEILELAPA